MKSAPLALTLGDPAGIGPEIIVKAWQALRQSGPVFMVVGDFQSLAAASRDGAAILRRVAGPEDAIQGFGDSLPVLDLPLQTSVVAGQPNANAGPAVVRWIETAAGLALSGDVSGMVTGPIAKASLYASGFGFPGHTEFLAELTAKVSYTGARGPVMMLTAGGLRTVLVTIHTPLAAVAASLTIERIVVTGVVAAEALKRDFGVERPRLAMAALNPHAGEGGSLGREEIDVLIPAARSLRDLGVDCRDPKPSDTLFHAEARASYDAVICMYHDQALTPVKMLDFWGGVNVTLGLPIIRASPDHGTGFDIAGRGRARADSLIAALHMAADMAARRYGASAAA